MKDLTGRYFECGPIYIGRIRYPMHIIKILRCDPTKKFYYIRYTYPGLGEGWITTSALSQWTDITEAQALLESL